MKLKKLTLLLLMAVSFGFFFNACEETTSTGDSPIIDSINPITGIPGQVVTISGSNFGDYDQSISFVYFNGVKAEISADGTDILWADDEITAKVPAGATTGDVVVEVSGKKSNGIKFTIPSADDPSDLMATSFSENEVGLKWTLSTSESDANFQGYWLFYYEEGKTAPENPVVINKATSKYTVTGLTKGKIYIFELHAVIKVSGVEILSPKASVKWSPAIRFVTNLNGDPIKIYESVSDFGSGLDLFDDATNAPKNLKVASGTEWDLGLYTTGGVLQFGSAKNILAKYSSFSGTAKTVEMSAVTYDAVSLDDVYDSQVLSGQTFSEKIQDLATLTSTNNPVFVVRIKTAMSYNYAKVMVVKKNGAFLQGPVDNKYIEVVVSYQSTKDIPYAF